MAARSVDGVRCVSARSPCRRRTAARAGCGGGGPAARRRRALLLLLGDELAPASPTAGSEKMCALRLAHSSCVMQRRSSWQFSRPPHCVASIGSSTARMMSATETVSGAAREV